ncbi:MAG TPA: WbuC family cupin fold metalloprotein [Candidatus Methylomirabilis sp.]
MRSIDDGLLDAVTVRARESARRRHMHVFHGEYADPVQRMLNALEPDSYVPPHRHFEGDRVEVFVALRGRLGILEFDDAGAVRGALVLDPRGPVRGAEVPMGAWHTIVALDPGTVAYEVKEGPYDPARAKEPAPWAPAEGDPQVPSYLARLREAALAAPAPAS